MISKGSSKTVGWHGWEPSLAGVESPAPNGFVWMRDMFQWLETKQIESRWIYTTHPVVGIKCITDLKNVDLVILCWRWPMQSIDRYKERNMAYLEQMRLIAECYIKKIPFVVHDQDHMMSDNEISLVRLAGGTLTEPSLCPREEFEMLLYPYFPGQDNVVPYKNKTDCLVYIGNNYDRYESAKKYLGQLKRPGVEFFGNWNNGRTDPTQLKNDFPFVTFNETLPISYTVGILSTNELTIHLAKPSYYKRGLLAVRWIEAVRAGTVAALPEEWNLPSWVGGRVRNHQDIWELSDIDQVEYNEILESQRELVVEMMTPGRWLELIRQLT